MANTFKFGNGNWAVKDGYALAYNDENNNFKPLPFDFTRASSATTLNRQGLIETVGSGKPRIDFTDNTDGHLLLEPSRTNYITQSIDLADWSSFVAGGTVTRTNDYSTSPDGLEKATRIEMSGGSSIQWTYLNVSNLATYASFYVKSTGSSSQNFRWFWNNGSNGQDFTATTEWQRFEVAVSQSSSLPMGFTTNSDLSASDILVWGVQAEAGSYATSYIPTEGSSVTRLADDIELTLPDVDSFNSSNGFSVIAKFDIGATSGSSSVPFLFFNDDSSGTYIGFGSNTTNLRCRLNLSGTSYLNTQANAPRTQKNSLFTSCDSSGWSQGANGSTNHTGTNNASIFNRLASITFITSETYGIIKISELLVYNTRLSNTELQNLTS